jgi:hypothetical protein
MRTRTLSLIAAAGLISVAAAGALAASTSPDRQPTDSERAAIARVLQANGFVAWDEIELDDGRRWEIDDARLANGETYDVKLAPDTLRITRRSRDD